MPTIGLIQVIDGAINYITIEQLNNISIRYNSNGIYGYLIWQNETCLEDNFWKFNYAKDTVREIFMVSEKNKAVETMISNVLLKLEEEELELSELDFRTSGDFLNSLDDIFLDEGEFRCEYFSDIAIPYSLRFGEMEGDEFDNAIHECIDMAIDKLSKMI